MLRNHLNSFFKPLLLVTVTLGSLGTSLTAQAVSVYVNNFRGTWSAITLYSSGDVVGYRGQSYIAQSENSNRSPAIDTAVWYLLAAQGSQGVPGQQGLKGDPGPVGATGAKGSPGPMGATGSKGGTGAQGATGAQGPAGPTPVYGYRLVVGTGIDDDGTGRTLAKPDYATITAALNAIPSGNYDGTTCSARYLVKVLPGVYPERVTMKPCVDIEGSGELTTRITAAGGGLVETAATLKGASDAELRMLTVENTGGGDISAAIYNGWVSPRFKQVTASAAGGTYLCTGIWDTFSKTTMTKVTVRASGGSGNVGVYTGLSNTTMIQVTAIASGGPSYNTGVQSASSTLTVLDSSLHGGSQSLSPDPEGNSVIHVATSLLDGPVPLPGMGNRPACAGAYNASFAPLDSNCQ